MQIVASSPSVRGPGQRCLLKYIISELFALVHVIPVTCTFSTDREKRGAGGKATITAEPSAFVITTARKSRSVFARFYRMVDRKIARSATISNHTCTNKKKISHLANKSLLYPFIRIMFFVNVKMNHFHLEWFSDFQK